MRSIEKVVHKRGGVAYRVRYAVPSKVSGGRHGQTSQTFDVEGKAREFALWLDEYGAAAAEDRLQVERAEFQKRAQLPTMDQVAHDHIELLTSVTDGTRLTYERSWARAWAPLIGSLPADMIDEDAVLRAIQELASQGLSRKTLANHRGLLHSVCERAVRKGYLRTNPARGVRLPRTGEEHKVEPRFLTKAELGRIVAVMHPHYQPLLRFLIETGCRWGEAVALMTEGVRLDAKVPYVHIHQALKGSPDNVRPIGPTKTPKSNRRIPVTDPDLLADLRRLTEGRDYDALVFLAPKGGPVQGRTWWSDIWYPAIVAADLGSPRPRPHDLRHSFGSRMLDLGVPPVTVSRLMGHENISTTVDRYGHVSFEQMVAAMELASDAQAEAQRSRLRVVPD